jgi:hypothetical protein
LTHVPSLLCVKKNYTLVTGDDILDYLASIYGGRGGGGGSGSGGGGGILPSVAQQQQEPSAYSLTNATSNSNILSESYTSYSLSAEELSSKGQSANRPLHNYVAVDRQISIFTPAEDYKPDKLSADVTMESLQTQRMQDIGRGGGGGGGAPPDVPVFSPQQYAPPMQPAIHRHPQADPSQYNYASSNQMMGIRSTL